MTRQITRNITGFAYKNATTISTLIVSTAIFILSATILHRVSNSEFQWNFSDYSSSLIGWQQIACALAGILIALIINLETKNNQEGLWKIASTITVISMIIPVFVESQRPEQVIWIGLTTIAAFLALVSHAYFERKNKSVALGSIAIALAATGFFGYSAMVHYQSLNVDAEQAFYAHATIENQKHRVNTEKWGVINAIALENEIADLEQMISDQDRLDSRYALQKATQSYTDSLYEYDIAMLSIEDEFARYESISDKRSNEIDIAPEYGRQLREIITGNIAGKWKDYKAQKAEFLRQINLDTESIFKPLRQHFRDRVRCYDAACSQKLEAEYHRIIDSIVGDNIPWTYWCEARNKRRNSHIPLVISMNDGEMEKSEDDLTPIFKYKCSPSVEEVKAKISLIKHPYFVEENSGYDAYIDDKYTFINHEGSRIAFIMESEKYGIALPNDWEIGDLGTYEEKAIEGLTSRAEIRYREAITTTFGHYIEPNIGIEEFAETGYGQSVIKDGIGIESNITVEYGMTPLDYYEFYALDVIEEEYKKSAARSAAILIGAISPSNDTETYNKVLYYKSIQWALLSAAVLMVFAVWATLRYVGETALSKVKKNHRYRIYTAAILGPVTHIIVTSEQFSHNIMDSDRLTTAQNMITTVLKTFF